MPTQRTSIGGAGEPPDDGTGTEEKSQNMAEPTPEEDLGIPENMEFTEDPTGYVPDTDVKIVGGRKVRPVGDRHLKEAHERYAGDVPMHGPPSIGQAQGAPPDASYEDRRAEAQQRRDEPPSPSPSAQRKADELLSGFGSAPPQQTQQPYTQQQQQQPQQPQQQQTTADILTQAQQIEESAAAFEYLKRQETEARSRGDLETAAQAKAMAAQLSDEFNIEEVRIKKERHPAMQKLLSNLGLERIKPAEIEWCGTKWRFAPPTASLDYWQHKHMSEDGLNVAALMVAASLVGLDGEPLYKVLNIPTKGRYKVSGSGPTLEDVPTKYVTVNLYPKHCDCGQEVDIEDTECSVCGSLQDPFEMPYKLRLACAEKFYQVLEEKFGAYEELAQLLDMRAKTMKDRRFDKEEVFPLLKSSQKASTTAA